MAHLPKVYEHAHKLHLGPLMLISRLLKDLRTLSPDTGRTGLSFSTTSTEWLTSQRCTNTPTSCITIFVGLLPLTRTFTGTGCLKSFSSSFWRWDLALALASLLPPLIDWCSSSAWTTSSGTHRSRQTKMAETSTQTTISSMSKTSASTTVSRTCTLTQETTTPNT